MNSEELCKCPNLPQMITLELFKGNYDLYDSYLYNEVFLKELYNFKMIFRGKVVELKSYPLFEEKEESYFHLTCKIYEKNSVTRKPDLRRSERLSWLKPSIETDHNNTCKQSCFLMYERPYKKYNRICLLNPADRYFIVLEERKGYYLLITAYYIEYDNTLRKKLKEYSKYKMN